MPRLCGSHRIRIQSEIASRAKSLRLKSLDMSRTVGRGSLDTPKFGRKSLDMGRQIAEIPKFGRHNLNMGR